jgi:S-adenosylmethionine hydrolase
MKNTTAKMLIIVLGMVSVLACKEKKAAIVFQSDFGLKDGAVSAMKGVSLEVDPDLKLYDLTHEIPAYNIWEAAYRLQQTAPYWPKGTVFVSVVDPGVGTDRRSVVLKSKTGHYFVSPDNGSLTLVSEELGIESVRLINEELNRRKNSLESYTFHGRDVYAYTAARLAAGVIRYEEVGQSLPSSIIKIDYQKAVLKGDTILGNIPILDIQYGNVWTNIGDSLLKQLGISHGDRLHVNIYKNDSLSYEGKMPFVATFGEVPDKTLLAYSNSLLNLAFAINMASFSDSFKVLSGPEWKVLVRKARVGN